MLKSTLLKVIQRSLTFNLYSQVYQVYVRESARNFNGTPSVHNYDDGGFLGLLPVGCDGGNGRYNSTTSDKQFCRRYNENNKINYTYGDWADRPNQRIGANGIYCNATCDGYLCWPPTPAGETFYQNCPKGLLSNEKMCAFRRCGSEGLWLGRHLNDTSPKGWTNYTPCFPTLVQKILDKVNEDEAEAQRKFETAVNTRTIEMVGIVSSFLTICAAIFIFNAFPSLHNRRTVIHRHLFYALFMEVTVRMVLYTQQSYTFDGVEPLKENARKGIEYFPYVCEGAYVLLEYSRLVVYGWMFIEGIFLNTLISANTLRNEIPINYFYSGGWGVPAIVIAIWGTVVGRHYSKEPLNTCWYGYNYLPSYYIIQGPILAIVSINMLFLGTIMSVVVMKLRRTNDSELRKIQKTIRATLILLPLLGIINIFNLFDYPLDGSSTGFAIWAYFTHFFRSLQGVFISFIYCFSNGEVRKAIRKKCERRTWCRFGWIERRRRAFPPARPREQPVFAIADENLELVPVPVRSWTRSSSTHIVDIEAGTSHAEDLPDTIMLFNRKKRPNRNQRLPDNAFPNRSQEDRFRDDVSPTEERGRPRRRVTAGTDGQPALPVGRGRNLRDADTPQPNRVRRVRFQGIQSPPERRRLARMRPRAHSSSAMSTQPAQNLRDSDSVHPNRLYAVNFRDAQTMFEALNRLQLIARAHSSSPMPTHPNQDRRHSDTIQSNRLHAASSYDTGASSEALARTQDTAQAHSSSSHAACRYYEPGASSEAQARTRETAQAHSSTSHAACRYYEPGASSEAPARTRETAQAHSSTLRAWLDMPLSLPQARELGLLSSNPLAIATRASYEEDEFDRRFRELEENRASSSDNIARMPVRLSPFHRNPVRFNYACCYPHEVAPRRSQSFVRPDVIPCESHLRDGRAGSSCF